MDKTIVVSFTNDEQAGTVYGTIRKLKREGYFQAYSMYDNYAFIFAPSSEVDTILGVFQELAGSGISAQID